MSAVRNGQQAERFVRTLLRQRHPGALIVDLAPSFPCDLLALLPTGSPAAAFPTWYEVKSARDPWHALNAKLSPLEAEFARVHSVTVVRVLTKPTGECEVLQWGT